MKQELKNEIKEIIIYFIIGTIFILWWFWSNGGFDDINY